jgi:hypothetical protein
VFSSVSTAVLGLSSQFSLASTLCYNPALPEQITEEKLTSPGEMLLERLWFIGKLPVHIGCVTYAMGF